MKHFGHPLSPPSEALLLFTNEARATLTGSSSDSRTMRQRRGEVKKLRKEKKNSLANKKEEISASIAKSIAELMKKEKEMIEELEKETKEEIDALDEEIDRIQENEENLSALTMSLRALSEDPGTISHRHWQTLQELRESIHLLTGSKYEISEPPQPEPIEENQKQPYSSGLISSVLASIDSHRHDSIEEGKEANKIETSPPPSRFVSLSPDPSSSIFESNSYAAILPVRSNSKPMIQSVQPASSSSAPQALQQRNESDEKKFKGSSGSLLSYCQESSWQMFDAGDEKFLETEIPDFLAERKDQAVACIARHPSHPSSLFIAWRNGDAAVVDSKTRRQLSNFTLPPFASSVHDHQAIVVEDPNNASNIVFVVIELDQRSLTAYTMNGSISFRCVFVAFITAFTSIGRYIIVSTSDGFISSSDMFGKNTTHKWKAHSQFITGLACVNGPETEEKSDKNSEDDEESNYYVISSSFDRTVSAWRQKDGKLVWSVSRDSCIIMISTPDPLVSSFQDSSNSKSRDPRVLACAREDGRIEILEVWQGTLMYTLPSRCTRISAMTMNSDYLVFSGGTRDTTIYAWNWRNSEHTKVSTISGHTKGVYWIKLFRTVDLKQNENGEEEKRYRLRGLSHSLGQLIEWDLDTNSQLSSIPAGAKPMYHIWTSNMKPERTG